jgi:1-phosphatidylinositol-3-phosphate 5-kinase
MLGRGAVNRIKAWETKHAPEVQGSGMIRGIKSSEPWWWGKDTHVIPGCDVIVREGDLGSIIAFTLRCGLLEFSIMARFIDPFAS